MVRPATSRGQRSATSKGHTCAVGSARKSYRPNSASMLW